MSSKILIRQILLAVIIVLILSVAFLLYSVPASSVQNKPIPAIKKTIIVPKKEPISIGLPVHLDISKIKVSADLEQVGLTLEGAMDTPQNQNNVAWLQTGPRPGEPGNAVLAGHYGWKGGKPSVFDNLYKLRKGDEISIKDDSGANIYFVVREIRRYSPGANATAVFVASDEKSHLNLVTCEGTWDNTSKSYSTRLVIFSDRKVE